MVLKAKKEVPVPSELQELAEQFGIKSRGLKIIDGVFNAGATANGQLILGTLLLKDFTINQLKAVVAHEFAHLKRRHHLQLGLYLLIVVPYVFISSSYLPQAIACLVSLATMIYFMMPIQWLSEFDADEYASKIVGVENMISALEAFPGDPNEGSEDHPPIVVRIKRLKNLAISV
jgi:Zn-dependent protease with chaperone function